MQCLEVLVPNGSKPLCNFLVHISSVLPGASALAPGAEMDKRKSHCTTKKEEQVGQTTLVLIAVRSEDILG